MEDENKSEQISQTENQQIEELIPEIEEISAATDISEEKNDENQEAADDFISFRKFMVFTIDQKQFCVDTKNIDEIVNNTEIFPLPFVPENVEGIINVRGQPVTVFNPFIDAEGQTKSSANLKNCNVLKFKRTDEAFGIRISSVEAFVSENKADGIERLNVEKLKADLRKALGYIDD